MCEMSLRLAAAKSRSVSRLFVLASTALGIQSFTTQLHASIIAKHSLKEVAEHAEAVFVGTVESKQSQADKSGWVWSLYTFRVEHVLSGEIPEGTAQLRCLGGTAAGRSMRADGMPIFAPGERALIFADVDGHPLCQFSGWQLGVFRFGKTHDGVEVLTDFSGKALTGVDAENAVTTETTLEKAVNKDGITPPETSVADPVNTTGADAPRTAPPSAPVAIEKVIGAIEDFARAHAVSATTLRPTLDVVGASPDPAKR
jgi:hypothetical protein